MTPPDDQDADSPLTLRLVGGPLDGQSVEVVPWARRSVGAVYTHRDDLGVEHTYGWRRGARRGHETPPPIEPGYEDRLFYGGSYSRSPLPERE